MRPISFRKRTAVCGPLISEAKWRRRRHENTEKVCFHLVGVAERAIGLDCAINVQVACTGSRILAKQVQEVRQKRKVAP